MSLPTGHGVRVSVAALVQGVNGGGGAEAVLAARPTLTHLGFSMEANGITMEEVSGWTTSLCALACTKWPVACAVVPWVLVLPAGYQPTHLGQPTFLLTMC